MKPLWLLIGSVLLSVLVGVPAAGQFPLELQVYPAIGGAFFLTDPLERFALRRASGGDQVVVNGSFAHSYALGGSVGLRIIDRGVVEGVLFWVPTELTADRGLEGGRADVDAYMYSVNLLFLLPRIGRVEPFVTLGLGSERLEFDLPGVDSRTDFMWSFGPGATLALSERLGVRLDLKDCVTSFDPHLPDRAREPEHDLMLILGLSYRLPVGREPRPQASVSGR